MAKMIATTIAKPKPWMTKLLPIIDAVSINVTALITKRNKPRVITVTGKVKTTNIGFTIRFTIARMTLAIIAEEMLATSTPWKK